MADEVQVPAADVTDASASTETTAATDPMATAPAEPTQAQQEQAGELVDDKPSDEARQVAREDADWRAEHPNEPRIREANPNVGGESFAYLDHVSG